jgi:hypothetical protein
MSVEPSPRPNRCRIVSVSVVKLSQHQQPVFHPFSTLQLVSDLPYLPAPEAE